MYDNNQIVFNPFAQNLSIVKNYFKRPAVLTLGIVYIITLLASVAVSVMMIPAMTNMWGAMLSIPEIASEMTAEDMSMFSTYMSPNVMLTSMLSSMAPSLIITALMAASYIIIYVKSKDDNLNSTPQAGFTILYVLAILNLISAIMACLMILLMAAAIIIGVLVAAGESDPAVITIVITVCVIFVLMIAFLLTYAISNVRYLKSIKDSMNSVTLSCKGAGVYGGFSIVFGVFSILGVLGSLAMAGLIGMIDEFVPELAQYGILETIAPIYLMAAASSVVSAVLYITDAVIARGYKKYITNIVSGYMTPENPAPYMAEPAVNPTQCPNCTSRVTEDDVFCNSCGFKVR